MTRTVFHFGQFTVGDTDYYFYNGKYYADNFVVSRVISIEEYQEAYAKTI